MSNKQIADLLMRLADLHELNGDNPFRIRALRRGSEIIESYSEDVVNMDRKGLTGISGIGEGIADIVDEFKASGRVAEIDRLQKKFPSGILEIMELNGMGPKKAALLFKKLKIDSPQKLGEAARADKLLKIPGFGAKTQENILKSLAFAATSGHRVLISTALSAAREMKGYLETCPDAADVQWAGSLRRWKETIGDLDFLATSRNPGKVIEWFQKHPQVKRVLGAGQTKSSVVLASGLQCDLRVVDKKSYGAALLYFTGSKEHNVRLREIAQKNGWTLNEYGLFKIKDKTKAVVGKTEEDVYRKLGLQWIPPELREDRGEIDAARAHKIPVLVEEKDVRGDAHNHTSLTDGAHTLEQMAKAAEAKGWAWFYSGDHSPSLRVAAGLSPSDLMKKKKDVEALNKKMKKIFLGLSSEVDILSDGKMDYPDDVLKAIDCVIGSVHSRFKQSREEMTSRICNALQNDSVHVLGHWTGRLLNRREGYEFDMDEVLNSAKKTGTAIEINGQPQRQEIQDIHVKRAIEMGIPLMLSTDAHATDQLDFMTIAVHIARRGWAERKHLLNTKSESEIKKWLQN